MAESGVVLVAVEAPPVGPSGFSAVRMPCTADPASGSVIPMLMMASPSATAGSHRSLRAGDPEVLDPPGRTVVGQLAADGGGHVVAGDLLQHDGRLDVAHPEPAPLLADGHPEEVGGGQGGDRLPRDLAALVVLGRPRRHLTGRHIAGQLTEGCLVLGLAVRIVLVRRVVGHRLSPTARCRQRPRS